VLLIASAVGQTGVTIGPESMDLTLSQYTNHLVDTLEITINNGSAELLEWEFFVKTLPPVTFTKENRADCTLPENQDRITDNVWITRDNTRGLINIAREPEVNYDADKSDIGGGMPIHTELVDSERSFLCI